MTNDGNQDHFYLVSCLKVNINIITINHCYQYKSYLASGYLKGINGSVWVASFICIFLFPLIYLFLYYILFYFSIADCLISYFIITYKYSFHEYLFTPSLTTKWAVTTSYYDSMKMPIWSKKCPPLYFSPHFNTFNKIDISVLKDYVTQYQNKLTSKATPSPYYINCWLFFPWIFPRTSLLTSPWTCP